MSKTRRGYSDKFKERAFRLYRQFEGNARKVSRELDGRPSHVTITVWAEEGDWDGKIQASQNAVRKMLGVNKDPLVQRLVKDDVFIVEILSLLQGIALRTIKRKKSAIKPRNSNELVKLLQFISTEYRLRTGEKDRSGSREGEGLSKASLREIIAAELGGGADASEAATSIIASLRGEIRNVRKKKLQDQTRNIEVG